LLSYVVLWCIVCFLLYFCDIMVCFLPIFHDVIVCFLPLFCDILDYFLPLFCDVNVSFFPSSVTSLLAFEQVNHKCCVCCHICTEA
jgi:hypothetical protein